MAHGQSQGIEFTELPPGTSIVDVSYVCDKMSVYVLCIEGASVLVIHY